MTSRIAENYRKHFRITEEDRKRLSPQEIEDLEAFAKEMMEDDVPTEHFNERKFDASDAVLANMAAEKKNNPEPESK